MEIKKIKCDFTICRINDISNVDFTREFVFLSKTDDEISLVCESDYVPATAIASEADWKALKILGILDFGMVGVIAKISALLSEASISIFVVSTYNTDYIFVKTESIDKTLNVLAQNGYVIK